MPKDNRFTKAAIVYGRSERSDSDNKLEITGAKCNRSKPLQLAGNYTCQILHESYSLQR